MKRNYAEFEDINDRQWTQREIKVNWLAFEAYLRDLVETSATNENFKKSDVIFLLNEALAAFTGRGRAV